MRTSIIVHLRVEAHNIRHRSNETTTRNLNGNVVLLYLMSTVDLRYVMRCKILQLKTTYILVDYSNANHAGLLLSRDLPIEVSRSGSMRMPSSLLQSMTSSRDHMRPMVSMSYLRLAFPVTTDLAG